MSNELNESAFDRFAMQVARGWSRRNMLRLLGGGVVGGLVLGLAGCGSDKTGPNDGDGGDGGDGGDPGDGDDPYPTFECADPATDVVTAASLAAARTAIETQAPVKWNGILRLDVKLSPGGCVRYERLTTGTPGVDFAVETLYSNNTTLDTWQRQNGVTTSQTYRTGEGSRLKQEFATVAGGTKVVTTEEPYYLTDQPRRRTTRTPLGADTVRVVVEEETDGGFVTVAQYDEPAIRGNGFGDGEAATAQAPYRRAGVVTPRPALSMRADTCTDAQRQMIADLMADAVIQGTDCLNKLGQQALSDRMLHDFVRRNRIYNCVSGTDYIAAVDTGAGPDTLDLYINISQLPNGQAWEQVSTFFHELLHLSAGGHDKEIEARSKRLPHADQVYGCEAACFQPNASKCTCAACVKTNVCDRRCAGFKDCTAPTEVGAMCEVSATTRTWYESSVECEAGCIGGSCKKHSLDCDQCSSN